MTTAHHVHGITDDDGDLIQNDDYPWLDDSPSQPLDDDRRSLDASLDLTSQREDDLVSYRSPPFREADLPSTSASALTELEGLEAPLPVPPPTARGFGYDDGDDSYWPREREEGHTRSPTLPSHRSPSHSRSPSSSAPSPAGNTLDSLSRTISSLKSYVPSVPSGTLKSYVPSLKTYAEPSPPSVSRPLSFATFSAGEGEEGSARGRGRRRGVIRGDMYQAEEYVDFQGDARRGRVERDEDLYWDQQREHPRPRQEFERDYELDQDFDEYVRGEAEAGERLSGKDRADRELMWWAEGGDEPPMKEQEDGPLFSREEDGDDMPPQVWRNEQDDQAEDAPSRKIEQDGPSRRSEQIAPPSWRVPSRREGQQPTERRHHVRQKTVVPPTAVPPSRQQTIVPGSLLDRQLTIVPPGISQRQEEQEEEDTPVLAFTRQESGLAQAMRGVASDRSGAADPLSARGQAVVDLGEEDGSAQGAEETRTTTGGGAKHAYAHPAREADLISWARWDLLGDKRLLILSYIPSGLQIWDCTDLGTVTEVLNLNFSGAEWKELGFDVGRVVHAALLSSPVKRSESVRDSFREDRPFLGIILESAQDPESTTFVVYSLSRHRVVVRVPVPGPGARAESFLSNEDFIVVSTATPLPALHILSSTTFELLTTIAYSALAPYTTPSSHSFPTSHSTQQHYISNNPILLGTRQGISMTPIDKPNTHQHHHHHPRPHAVFALSKRLLAYACPPPSSSSSSSAMTTKDHRRLSSTSTQTSASAGSSSAASSWKSMTQAQGELALKVGGSMLSGMKFLGGMAYDAALKRGSGAGEPPPPPAMSINRLFSRSAPTKREGEEEEEEKRRRRYSGEPSIAAAANQVFERERKAGGYHVRVVDLASLATMGNPRVVLEFQSSRSQPIADLRFSKDGCSLAVIPRDGHLIKVFQLRPAPAVLFGGGGREDLASQAGSDLEQSGSVWHLYDLRRGRTSAVVEGMDWAQDGRWLAIGTRNRTVHVFPVNPYGGKVDVKSHLEGRVRNVLAGATIPAKTEVTPLVRLRGVRSQQVSPSSALEYHSSSIAPLAFIFLNPSDVTIPPSLLPSLPTVVDPTSSPPLSPRRAEDRSRNYQDVLLFDSADGMLSLRRFTVEQHPKEPSLPSTVVQASVSAATSISFPGMGGAGRLSVSPSSAGTSASTRPSALTKMMDTPELELSAKERVVATWNLQRRRDWGEIKRRLVDNQQMRDWGGLAENLDWLSQAEITTFSKSQRVLPRSLYLCHQFSFHTLGEDYHALIRRYQFDISGHKIEVRKEVEVNAFSSTTTEGGAGESFVEGSFSSSPRDIRRFSTSFDEPLASALGAGFNHSLQSNQAIIPMFPNGTPGSKPKSFRSSIPIRTMAGFGDGMSEGFGRIRREIQHKVRSPLLAPRSDSSVSGSVPLEFDEEDEDFLGGGVGALLDAPVPVPKQREGSSVSRGTSRDDGVSVDSSLSTSSASVNIDDDVVGTVDEDIWQGWDYQDKMAIEEAERFDDISAVGFLNAEQEVSKPIATTDGEGRKRTGRERRKH